MTSWEREILVVLANYVRHVVVVASGSHLVDRRSSRPAAGSGIGRASRRRGLARLASGILPPRVAVVATGSLPGRLTNDGPIFHSCPPGCTGGRALRQR